MNENSFVVVAFFALFAACLIVYIFFYKSQERSFKIAQTSIRVLFLNSHSGFEIYVQNEGLYLYDMSSDKAREISSPAIDLMVTRDCHWRYENIFVKNLLELRAHVEKTLAKEPRSS